MVQLVLLERIAKLGQMGDVVNVKPGYARNFLLPQGKALPANSKNLKKFEAEKANLEAANLESKKEADRVQEKIEGEIFVLIRSASESGSLYGSVTSRDIEEASTSQGFKINRKQVILDKPIKELGIHELVVSLHPEVLAKIKINVARSVEEANIQKSGKSISDGKSEDESEKVNLSEMFDDEETATKVNLELQEDSEASDLKETTNPKDKESTESPDAGSNATEAKNKELVTEASKKE